MDNATASLLGGLFGLCAGIFLGAIVVQFATKWVAGFKPGYGIACLAVFVGYLASIGAGLVIGLGVGVSEARAAGGVAALALVAGFFAQAGFFSFMLKNPDGVPIGYGKACIVSLVQNVLAALAVAIIVLLALGAASLAKE